MRKTITLIVVLISISNCYSQTAALYFSSGDSKVTKGNYTGAIADYTKAIELKPDFADAYYNRGKNKFSLQDYRGAIADYTKYLEFKKLDAKTYHKGSLKAYIQVTPADAYYWRGYSKSNLKNYTGAIADYTKAIELKPVHVSNSYLERGRAKLELGQKDSGCLDLSKAGELGNGFAYLLIKIHCN